MDNAVEKRFSRGQIALTLPLIGLFLMWLFFLVAQVVDLYRNYGTPTHVNDQNSFHAAIYLFLLGIASAGILSVTARRMANGLEATRLSSAIRGFSLVAVIASLIIATIYGFAIFIATFNLFSYDGKPVAPNELMRILNVYLPLILDAALMVHVILRAFVNKVEPETEAENE